MSFYRHRLTSAIDARFAIVVNVTANLKAQLYELNRLRERVREAELAQRSLLLRRRKRTRLRRL
jgi:hypothetical protein